MLIFSLRQLYIMEWTVTKCKLTVTHLNPLSRFMTLTLHTTKHIKCNIFSYPWTLIIHYTE